LEINEDYLVLFTKISLHRMIDHYLPKLHDALGVLLTKEQLWERHGSNTNSIGSIVLHIVEHLGRHIERFTNPSIKYTKGIEEYFPNDDLELDEVLSLTIDSFTEWGTLLNQSIQNPEILYKTIDMISLYHLVEHTGYHLGQIVDRIKIMTGKSFSFCQIGINEVNLNAVINRSDRS